jgi:hypothetical protein
MKKAADFAFRYLSRSEKRVSGFFMECYYCERRASWFASSKKVDIDCAGG